jgi:hypothetical protein
LQQFPDPLLCTEILVSLDLKASYATMLFVRADIVKNAGGVLSKVL